MTVDRPYREALSLSKAKEQIQSGAGVAFDPEVVEAFIRAWPEIEKSAKKVNTGKKPNLLLQTAIGP